MQIVIDISEDLYKAAINGLSAEEIWDLRLAIKNGTPLPKGHGRLIDADVLPEISLFGTTEYINVYKAPTIIEADKAESEE